MSKFKAFFENLDFTFGQNKDIVQKEIVFSNNEVLTRKIKNNIYFYNSPKNLNTSFYFFDIVDLNDEELFELRRYIWNEDKSEFYFYPDNRDTISLYYAKSDPKIDKEKIKIDTFKGQNDTEIDKIKKWNFETGIFWLSYKKFVKKIKKYNKIDKLLIDRLSDLKEELISELGKDKEKEVQALIDRTLFIKFLEDRHIINSYFYKIFFNDENLTYKKLLAGQPDVDKINLLYKKINEIFDNVLFKTPQIEDEYILKSSKYIYNAISGEIKGQLSLFDFRFDIIPIEFISHIYEVFLENKQANEGIYYTPPKLAQLIIDDTITKSGKVLDPACGSGMFLILAFRKMLTDRSLSKNKNISETINKRLKLLKDNIFGIEKQYTAWRLSIFALYLEIFNGLKPDEIKAFIIKKINSGNIKIFEDFSSNIKNENTLEVKEDKIHFKNKTFDYIIGNPPFLQVKKNDIEIDFINEYKLTINKKEFLAKNTIGNKQISQAFMLKIKDWADDNTKFGFVLNSSNFYNERKSIIFQEFFFENYQIKNFYELSRVRKILFNKAKESVVVVIFNNKKLGNNTINYYPVDLELFSETFNILVIKEDNKIKIKQKELLNRNITLRELLVGNEFDLQILNKLLTLFNLSNFLLKNKNYSSIRGLTRISNNSLREFLNITHERFKKLSKKDKINAHQQFAYDNYLSKEKTDFYNTQYIYKPENKITKFRIIDNDGYINEADVNKTNFQRPRNLYIYRGKKILLNRFGNEINAVFVKNKLFFSNLIYGIKLQNENHYLLFTAILNSELVNYFLTQRYRMRVEGNYSNLDTTAIKNIPIPKDLDNETAKKISEISKQLTEGKIKYEGKVKEELNELIYDLYDLNYLERQRVKDFFSPKRKVLSKDMEKYRETLSYTLEMYFEQQPKIEYSIDKSFGFDIVVVGLFFNNKKSLPTSQKVLKYQIAQIMQQSNNNLFAMREFLFGEDCIYIIKDKQLKNWTETKAFEDGKLILKKLS